VLIGWSILLILHGILAVLLLGAITHQAVGVVWPVSKRSPGFLSAVRGVNGMNYTNAVIVLFLVTFVVGTIIYPTYRVNVRTVLQEYRDFKPEGMFEMKEHLLALSLGRRQEAGAVQPVEDRSGKAVAGRPVASVA
jgi:hypothetical protein